MAIIAMLLPALSKAREKAKQAVCVNNLKQIGLAFRMYLEDYDGYYPPQRRHKPEGGTAYIPDDTDPDSQISARVWPCLLAKYTYPWWQGDPNKLKLQKSNNIFFCPSDRINTQTINSRTYAMAAGYISGEQYRGVGLLRKDWKGVKDSQIKNPNEVILVTERPIWYGGITKRDGRHIIASESQSDIDAIPLWHQGGSNYLFCDGHVEYIKGRLKGDDKRWYAEEFQ